MEEKACYIIGAGEFEGLERMPGQGDFVIAADGGFRYLKNAGIQADILIGDMDSLDEVPVHPHIITLQKEKDDTDMLSAVRYGLDKGYRLFYLYGGTGGRLDHTLANLQCLAFLTGKGARGRLFGPDFTVTLLKDGSMEFGEEYSGYISIFAYGGEAEGVTLRNLKYELSEAVLTPEYPVGVSNEFIGKQGRVSVRKGTLAILWYRRSFGNSAG